MRMLFYENVTGHGTKNTVSPHICIISEGSRNTEAFFFFFFTIVIMILDQCYVYVLF